jgi:hypothetical protein
LGINNDIFGSIGINTILFLGKKQEKIVILTDHKLLKD